MWQEYHVFGLTRAGEGSEEGKEENTEVRLYYNNIPAEYMENFEVRKSSTFTKLRQGNLAVITFGAYTSGRIDTILK